MSYPTLQKLAKQFAPTPERLLYLFCRRGKEKLKIFPSLFYKKGVESDFSAYEKSEMDMQ